MYTFLLPGNFSRFGIETAVSIDLDIKIASLVRKFEVFRTLYGGGRRTYMIKKAA
ncbi:hypothetical protein ADA01nite_38460 [Aneurinibacillus danicus]|jgi:hypothetical protein|uniref:Uncharacterized protein n=1 Tax=Aneurinibacillus danicus TaxID=267746 RepID=A0A511VBT9_9BACL|nr:hypothetical protein ADA01nite_38460 [Aneurinibacillus danicus]